MNELIGIAAIAIVGWFAAGTIVNVRKASALMRWMQDGLPLLGSRAAVRWLGSTAVEITIRDVREPFASVAVVIFLEPRDLPWWPLSRWRGRRDTLIVRCALRAVPAFELEAIDRTSWSGRDALSRLPREWPATSVSGLEVHHSDARALDCAKRMLARAGDAGFLVRRLSVRRSEPHFQMHVGSPEASRSAREFFQSLRELSELARDRHDSSA